MTVDADDNTVDSLGRVDGQGQVLVLLHKIIQMRQVIVITIVVSP